MAIELVKKNNTKKKIEPYYILTYKYMIGDANGSTSEEVKLPIDNPFIERYVKLINSLKPIKGHWGVMLKPSRFRKHKEEGQITEDDYFFLMRTMFFEELEVEGEEEAMIYFKTEQDNKWANQFYEGVRAETEYSFLVFQGAKLTYVDEFREKHETIIT